jgi:hypothetical protein
VPVSLTADACSVITGTIFATFEAIDRTFTDERDDFTSLDDRKVLNKIVNALIRLGQAAGCTGGQFD